VSSVLKECNKLTGKF